MPNGMRNMQKPRITVLGVNPGIDRTMYFDNPLARGDVNRACRVVQHGGCKSGNAATVLARLGAKVNYVTYTGGELAALYESYYTGEPMTLTPIQTAAGVRMNVKLSDGEGVFTECNQSGGPVSEKECAAMMSALEKADFDCLYLAGSIPRGMPADFYATCVKMARKKGAYTVVDAEGAVLKAALEAAPDLVKPNRAEFEKLIPQGNTISEKIALFREKYPQTVLLLSLGGDGAVLSDKENLSKVNALPVCVKGTVAAGDTFLSAFTVATLRGDSFADALKKATAAAAAKVALEGTALPSKPQMQERVKEVIVTEFQDK